MCDKVYRQYGAQQTVQRRVEERRCQGHGKGPRRHVQVLPTGRHNTGPRVTHHRKPQLPVEYGGKRVGRRHRALRGGSPHGPDIVDRNAVRENVREAAAEGGTGRAGGLRGTRRRGGVERSINKIGNYLSTFTSRFYSRWLCKK